MQIPRSLFYFGLSFIIHISLMFLYLPKVEKEKKKQVTEAERVLKVYLKTKKQIVRSEESKDREIKENSFLSDKTRSFERESVAKRISPFQGGGSGSSTPKTKKEITLSDLGFKKTNDLYKTTAPEKSRGESSATNDHIKDIPLGDHTYLNTVEYKYYGFYFRIRQRLEQFWGRSIHETAMKLVEEKRQIRRDDEHITALRIELDHEGNITAIKVVGTSGVRELDDAAIRAFNEAGPFPNPPKGLVVKGKVTLEWGFVVKT